MITLHHLNNSRSQRVIWLLESLEVDYQIEFYQRDPVTILAPDSLKKVHPLGKSPVITDSKTGITVAESGAIIEYLLHEYGSQYQPSEDQKWQHSYWMHFAEGSLMPPMVMRLVFEKVKNSPMPFFVKPIAKSIANKVLRFFVSPNIKASLTFIEQSLEGKKWILGDQLTGADFQMSFPLEASKARGLVNPDQHPNICRYVEQIHQLEGYQRGLEKGGKYDYA